MSSLSDWARDYVYMLRGSISFIRREPRHYKNQVAENKVPVILLSGIYFKWHFMRHMAKKISYAGHPVYIIPSLGRNLLSIPFSAKIVYEILEKNDLKNVVIIGYSKGGLVAKEVLANYNEDNRVAKEIAIAAPFEGSRLAGAIPHKAFKELAPNSQKISSLKDERRVNKKIVSIMPEYDNHVWHEKGSYLKGAKNIKVPVRGHHKVLYDKDVIDKILSILDKVSKESADT